jgi:ABC-2 type transport system ATP-binding protein
VNANTPNGAHRHQSKGSVEHPINTNVAMSKPRDVGRDTNDAPWRTKRIEIPNSAAATAPSTTGADLATTGADLRTLHVDVIATWRVTLHAADGVARTDDPRGQNEDAQDPPRGRFEMGSVTFPVTEPMNNTAIVAITNLTKRYGALAAVDNLSLTLEPGTVTGFLGPNGAGKTTTLRLLLGLAEPTTGTALIRGRRYVALEHPAQLVGAVLESGDFHPSRSGRDHLRVLATATDIEIRRVDEVLDTVGLSAAATRPVKTYSLGMRQRLGLAGALLGEPELLVLDEPANGLDPAGVHWLRSVLRSFADAGGTVLVSSHLLAEVAQSVDRIIIIDRGQTVADAPLADIVNNGQTLEDAYLALTTSDAT